MLFLVIFADLVDGVFYFYPWGDNWLTKNLTNVQVLERWMIQIIELENNIAHYLENYSIVSFYEK